MYSVPDFEPVCCSMYSSNCCFLMLLTAAYRFLNMQVGWYSHLFKNFPQFVVIHKVKGFGIGNKAEIDVFLVLSCFFDEPADVGNLISGSSAFSKTSVKVLERWAAERRYPTSKVRSSSCTLLEQPWRETPCRREKKLQQDGRHWEKPHETETTITDNRPIWSHGPQPCLTQWN